MIWEGTISGQMCDCEVSLSGTDDKPRDWLVRAGDPSDHKFIVSEMETIYKLIPLLNSHKMLLATEFVFHVLSVFLISSRGINDSHIDRSGIQIPLPPAVDSRHLLALFIMTPISQSFDTRHTEPGAQPLHE